jgi:hypothetical protein
VLLTPRNLKKVLGELKGPFFPTHAMRNPDLATIFIAVGYVPVVVAKQCISIGVARYKTHFGFKPFDGHEAFLSRGVINPLVDR